MKTIEFDTHFYKKLWTLMVPIMVQNLMLALVAVADAFMLGGLDQNYMSAVSLATQIQFIQNMFLSAATAGLAILGAQYWGKQDIKALDDIFGLAIRICGIVSVLFFVACAFSHLSSVAPVHPIDTQAASRNGSACVRNRNCFPWILRMEVFRG
jgi:Na+-driven multidrug efflux pump